MAKIGRVEDLPGWFNLREYQSCESFMAIDWLTCLKTRQLIIELISIGDIYGASDLAERVRNDPTDCFRLDWEALESPVRPLSFADIAFKGGMSLMLGPAFPKEAEQWAQTANKIAAGDWIPDSSMRTPIENSNDESRSLFVNLRATDSVLKDAFSAWLKDVRSQQRTASKRERPAYHSWARYGLLPYLDLFIWTKLTGNQIPYQLMSEAVGYCQGGSSKGGESFQRNVRPLRLNLPQKLAELEALAAIEAHQEEPAT
ncbi:DUF6387 family protein [Metapseudomonas boanensis]|uniref:Uncharacterized protein n=1 Tax=Metapseudomonas boanensis TaxID=2822138 RepID=A0ABS5XK45_9GAMM|nr:DUF6387 family protein [Pseudomonas boanensis]MBT8768079.1 hypothetical protein [Pseudomonas boanensis]